MAKCCQAAVCCWVTGALVQFRRSQFEGWFNPLPKGLANRGHIHFLDGGRASGVGNWQRWSPPNRHWQWIKMWKANQRVTTRITQTRFFPFISGPSAPSGGSSAQTRFRWSGSINSMFLENNIVHPCFPRLIGYWQFYPKIILWEFVDYWERSNTSGWLR